MYRKLTYGFHINLIGKIEVDTHSPPSEGCPQDGVGKLFSCYKSLKRASLNSKPPLPLELHLVQYQSAAGSYVGDRIMDFRSKAFFKIFQG